MKENHEFVNRLAYKSRATTDKKWFLENHKSIVGQWKASNPELFNNDKTTISIYENINASVVTSLQ